MAKKENYNGRSTQELAKIVEDKREALRALRFSTAGSKNRDVKLASKLRKEIARATGALNQHHGN